MDEQNEQNENNDIDKMEQITKDAAKETARKTAKLAKKAIKELIKKLIKVIGLKGFLIILAIVIILIVIPLLWYGVTKSTYEGFSDIIDQNINGTNIDGENNSNSGTIGLLRSKWNCYYRRKKL